MLEGAAEPPGGDGSGAGSGDFEGAGGGGAGAGAGAGAGGEEACDAQWLEMQASQERELAYYAALCDESCSASAAADRAAAEEAEAAPDTDYLLALEAADTARAARAAISAAAAGGGVPLSSPLPAPPVFGAFLHGSPLPFAR